MTEESSQATKPSINWLRVVGITAIAALFLWVPLRSSDFKQGQSEKTEKWFDARLKEDSAYNTQLRTSGTVIVQDQEQADALSEDTTKPINEAASAENHPDSDMTVIDRVLFLAGYTGMSGLLAWLGFFAIQGARDPEGPTLRLKYGGKITGAQARALLFAAGLFSLVGSVGCLSLLYSLLSGR